MKKGTSPKMVSGGMKGKMPKMNKEMKETKDETHPEMIGEGRTGEPKGMHDQIAKPSTTYK
jgi:hypothetical protein